MTSDLLGSSVVGAKKIFNDTFLAGLETAPWLRLVLDGKAQDAGGKASMDYGWLLDPPTMNRWSGELEVGTLVGEELRLTNHLHTAAFDVDRLAADRDQLGMIPPKTRQLSEEANRFIGEQIYGLLNGGGSVMTDSPTFDGAAFFGSSRVIGSSAAIDNTQTTAGATAANFRTDLTNATSVMMRYENSQGKPINRSPNVIVIPPEDLGAAWEGLNIGSGSADAPVAPASGDGTVMFTARGYTVVVSAYISDTGARYFLHVSPGWSPLIFQQEFAPQLESDVSPTGYNGFHREKFTFKVRGSFATGFGDPRLAILYT